MELHFNPDKSHYIHYIKGAVLSCCKAIIEILDNRGSGNVIFEDVDLQAVFNPYDDYVVMQRICGLFYNQDTRTVEVMGTSEFGHFGEDFWNAFNAPEVIGKIYKTLREIEDLEK